MTIRPNADTGDDAAQSFLDTNLAHFRDHIETFVDRDLVEIDREFLCALMAPVTAQQEEEAQRVARDAMTAALRERAPDLLPLFGEYSDASTDLAVAYEASGRSRGIALACAMRPSHTHPLDISTWEAWQLFPIPGSVPDADATHAEVIARLEQSAALDADA